MTTPRQALDNFADALVTDIMALSDEELVAEFIEDDGDLDANAEQMRALFEQARRQICDICHMRRVRGCTACTWYYCGET